MAQSPKGAAQTPAAGSYVKAWKAMARMIREGRSWSGHERNCCFLNTGESRFADVSAVSGIDFRDDGRSLSIVDWDHDGDLDFWATNRNGPRVRFLRNESPAKNHFLSVRLFGRTCNRDAIGARVELFLAGERQTKHVKTVRAGEGFLGQSSKWVHFGLGRVSRIEKLVVRWPGAPVEEFSGLQVDAHYLIVQGGEPERWVRPARGTELASAQLTMPTESSQSRVVLLPRRRMPPMEFLDIDGRPRVLNAVGGQPILINLWSPSCLPCLKELADFTRNAEQIRSAGLQIAAINVDRIDEPLQSDPIAVKHLQKTGFPFLAGTATSRTAGIFEKKHLFERLGPYPLPSSFLLDADRRLSVVYIGPVSVKRLLQDVALLAEPQEELMKTAIPFAGRWAEAAVPPPPPSVDAAPKSHEFAILATVGVTAVVILVLVAVCWRRFRCVSVSSTDV